MTDLPGPEIAPARRSLLERVSVVWLVPLAALVISLAIAWQNYASRGPLIEIAFADAEGVRAGETELRFRNVAVGVVEDVSFSPGLGAVLVSVRLDQEIAPYVDEGSEFWVVRPRVTAQGVSGLSTVLGGVFIQGSWDARPGETGTRFTGLDTAPVTRPDLPGLQIVLSSETGEGLLQGTPILYRGLQVGAVADLRLAPNGQTVLSEAFIEEPYDRLITTSTRFWNASGFSFSLGPQGATLDVSSLAALVSGGVALENLVTGGDPVEPGAVFQLFAGRAEALSSVFADPATTDRVTVGFVFSGDVSGLSSGSPVELQGIRIGQVAGVTGIVDEERFGDRRVRLLAAAELDPARIVVREGEAEENAPRTAEQTFETLAQMAETGVRASLARGSILTGGLKIVLAEQPDATPAAFDRGAEPFPIFPTTSSQLPQVSDTVEGLISRVNDLPIEEVLDGVTTLLRNVNAVIDSDAVRAAPDEILGLVGDVRALVGSEAVQQAPVEIAAILTDLQAAVTDVREVLAEFRDAGAATALTEALTAAAPAIARIDQLLATAEPAVAGLPELFERLGEAATDIAAVAATAADLPLAQLVEAATQTVDAANELVASDALRQAPQDFAAALADVSATLVEVSATLGDVRDSQVIPRAGTALDAAGDAAVRLAAATEGLPALIARVEAVAASVEALPLAATVEAAERTLTSADEILTSEALRAAPAELNAALGELRTVVAEIRSAGLVARVDGTLAAAEEAAGAIREATAGVPDVVAGIGEFARTANDLPLERLTANAADLAEAAQALLATQGAQELPASFNAALSEVEAALRELREGGLIDSANQTLASARDAAAAVEQASVSLPELARRLDALADQAERTLAGYAEGSELNRSARTAMREVEAAARAVASLARQIERNPNSLLLGR